MRTISLHVPDADYTEMKVLASEEHRPVAEIIREAMSAWLQNHRRFGSSLLDIEPVDCGRMLRPFDRAEVAEEMFDR